MSLYSLDVKHSAFCAGRWVNWNVEKADARNYRFRIVSETRQSVGRVPDGEPLEERILRYRFFIGAHIPHRLGTTQAQRR
jgi:hypothetical protein